MHPISHLYPLELSLMHEYRTPLPTIANLPEDIDPGLDFSNSEEIGDDVFNASDSFALEPDGVQEPVFESATVPSDVNILPLNEIVTADIHNSDDHISLTPPVQVTRYGRRVVPPSVYQAS